MSSTIQWVALIVPLLIAVVGWAWTVGGHQALVRRRLSQELEMLQRVPESSREEFEAHVEKQIADYLRWIRRPLWWRLTWGSGLIFPPLAAAWITYGTFVELPKSPTRDAITLSLLTLSAVGTWGFAIELIRADWLRRQEELPRDFPLNERLGLGAADPEGKPDQQSE
ncbi:hypothetical protein [Actinopolymorpha rutila]|uniref:Uncharacterized protein n=1 Tax=Actinopolymorpha rutila TaxID=446787 RepID=A0A852ZIH7_9ACTN|nr:hypothetical protein [Actinopolymorpha rutila]NYH92857.1 hypothetical protein [Actinopolymorpha rutila]